MSSRRPNPKNPFVFRSVREIGGSGENIASALDDLQSSTDPHTTIMGYGALKVVLGPSSWYDKAPSPIPGLIVPVLSQKQSKKPLTVIATGVDQISTKKGGTKVFIRLGFDGATQPDYQRLIDEQGELRELLTERGCPPETDLSLPRIELAHFGENSNDAGGILRVAQKIVTASVTLSPLAATPKDLRMCNPNREHLVPPSGKKTRRGRRKPR